MTQLSINLRCPKEIAGYLLLKTQKTLLDTQRNCLIQNLLDTRASDASSVVRSTKLEADACDAACASLSLAWPNRVVSFVAQDRLIQENAEINLGAQLRNFSLRRLAQVCGWRFRRRVCFPRVLHLPRTAHTPIYYNHTVQGLGFQD